MASAFPDESRALQDPGEGVDMHGRPAGSFMARFQGRQRQRFLPCPRQETYRLRRGQFGRGAAAGTIRQTRQPVFQPPAGGRAHCLQGQALLRCDLRAALPRREQ